MFVPSVFAKMYPRVATTLVVVGEWGREPRTCLACSPSLEIIPASLLPTLPCALPTAS
jgi:hypothetical protein